MPLSYIAPAFRNDPRAKDFNDFLTVALNWRAEDFASGYAWETEIPPVERWREEADRLNEHIETL